jgi:hypothetical protein
MRVIFMDVPVGRWGLPSVEMEKPAVAFTEPCLKRGVSPAGELVVRVGVPLLDDFLEFLAGRARPNTVLAAGYDVVVFFRFVAKEPHEVTSADVLAFVTSLNAAVPTVAACARFRTQPQSAPARSAAACRRSQGCSPTSPSGAT